MQSGQLGNNAWRHVREYVLDYQIQAMIIATYLNTHRGRNGEEAKLNVAKSGLDLEGLGVYPGLVEDNALLVDFYN